MKLANWLVLPTAFLLVLSCTDSSTPEKVYADYISSVQVSDSVSSGPYRDYLTKRALDFVDSKLERLSENASIVEGGSLEESFLFMFKAEATLPEVYSQETSHIENSAVMKISISNYNEEGTEHLRTIYFMEEDGWKIDKIDTITSGKNEDGSNEWSVESSEFY